MVGILYVLPLGIVDWRQGLRWCMHTFQSCLIAAPPLAATTRRQPGTCRRLFSTATSSKATAPSSSGEQVFERRPITFAIPAGGLRNMSVTSQMSFYVPALQDSTFALGVYSQQLMGRDGQSCTEQAVILVQRPRFIGGQLDCTSSGAD